MKWEEDETNAGSAGGVGRRQWEMNGGEELSKGGWGHGGKEVFLSSFTIGVLGMRKRKMGDERFEKGWVGRVR